MQQHAFTKKKKRYIKPFSKNQMRTGDKDASSASDIA